MTAALDLAGVSPELIEALTEQVVARLALVPARAATEALSTLAASIRRRACERRQADAVRGDRSGIDPEGLSAIPASVRRREWKRRQAAAKKAAIDPSRMYLHGRAYEEHGSEPPPRVPGPLAGDVAGFVDRAESRKKLELARLYGVIRDGLALGSKGRIALPRVWAKRASEKEDARKLLATFGLAQIKAAAVSLGETWKPSAEFSRPTVSLILWRLEVWRAGSRPSKRTESRRATGEQIEERDRARARAAAPATKGAASPRAAEVNGADTSGAPAHSPTTAGPVPVSPPLQLAEPSPSSSAEAREVLDLVNVTAARCRAFKHRGAP